MSQRTWGERSLGEKPIGKEFVGWVEQEVGLYQGNIIEMATGVRKVYT